jgi:hypothetical protein
MKTSLNTKAVYPVILDRCVKHVIILVGTGAKTTLGLISINVKLVQR